MSDAVTYPACELAFDGIRLFDPMNTAAYVAKAKRRGERWLELRWWNLKPQDREDLSECLKQMKTAEDVAFTRVFILHLINVYDLNQATQNATDQRIKADGSNG